MCSSWDLGADAEFLLQTHLSELLADHRELPPLSSDFVSPRPLGKKPLYAIVSSKELLPADCQGLSWELEGQDRKDKKTSPWRWCMVVWVQLHYRWLLGAHPGTSCSEPWEADL